MPLLPEDDGAGGGGFTALDEGDGTGVALDEGEGTGPVGLADGAAALDEPRAAADD